ncbi:hypothetical protein LP419_26990 [Massilia sp. H-1]|nr:hypothetical protein LP419_26990 [Massilia sp. H-1]
MGPYAWHRPYWGGRRYWGGGWYSPFYDPFWSGMPRYTEVIKHFYNREVQVAIKSAADGKRLFDVTVRNSSRDMSTPNVMPAAGAKRLYRLPRRERGGAPGGAQARGLSKG